MLCVCARDRVSAFFFHLTVLRLWPIAPCGLSVARAAATRALASIRLPSLRGGERGAWRRVVASARVLAPQFSKWMTSPARVRGFAFACGGPVALDKLCCRLCIRGAHLSSSLCFRRGPRGWHCTLWRCHHVFVRAPSYVSRMP
ncbi:hypothetical protein TRVL_09150 [Trypanosoma vivax]|uniref:Uncharacterized protein n=1 Tax=Trypanosoma vivax (strain Y486) TaxID=1055687 RepID=G0UCM6_TRYVY|nr:hypothetical protein TRVL_09150 [Trypanosoma vivax]CCC53586.1 hypothetical protein TVY486_1110700 [Trypanosoma vivax Y486]